MRSQQRMCVRTGRRAKNRSASANERPLSAGVILLSAISVGDYSLQRTLAITESKEDDEGKEVARIRRILCPA